MKQISLGLFLFFLILMGFVLLPIFHVAPEAVSILFLSTEPEDMGRTGGIGPVIVSSLMMNLAMIMIVLNIGIPIALKLSFLSAQKSIQYQVCRKILDVLASTPSIVFGLFGNAFFVSFLGFGYSLLAGAFTLSLMVLPLFIGLVEETLACAQGEFGNLCSSLGIGEVRTTFRILLPAVLPSIAAAMVLAWTRAIGETAALLVTSGYSVRWPGSLFDSGRSLSVHIFDLSMNVPNGDHAALKTAFVLLVLTLAFTVVSKLIMKAVFKWNFTTTL